MAASPTLLDAAHLYFDLLSQFAASSFHSYVHATVTELDRAGDHSCSIAVRPSLHPEEGSIIGLEH